MSDRELFQRYQAVMEDGQLVQVYRDVLALLRETAREIECRSGGAWRISALHPGELDVSFFTVVTEVSAKQKLKYVIAFVHKELSFELWLSGTNQKAMSMLRGAAANWTSEKQLPLRDDMTSVALARWSLGGAALWEQGSAVVAEEAIQQIQAVDSCLAER